MKVPSYVLVHLTTTPDKAPPLDIFSLEKSLYLNFVLYFVHYFVIDAIIFRVNAYIPDLLPALGLIYSVFGGLLGFGSSFPSLRRVSFLFCYHDFNKYDLFRSSFHESEPSLNINFSFSKFLNDIPSCCFFYAIRSFQQYCTSSDFTKRVCNNI